MLDAIQIVITLILMIIAGYWVSAKGWVSEKTASFISKLVVLIGVPCAALDNILNNFDQEMLSEAGIALLIPLLTVGITFFIGYSLAKALKLPLGSHGVFATLIACSNTIFIGLPVCEALFGEAATAYVLMYDVGHVAIFWTLGAYFMQMDGEVRKGTRGKTKLFSTQMLKKVFSPGLISLIVAILLVLLKINLPSFAMKSFRYLGSLCTPMALIYIGYVLQKTGLKNIRFHKESWLVVLGRAVLCPAVAFGLLLLFKAPVEMTQVYVAQASMPVMTSTALVAAEYGSDDRFATEAMVLTMVVSFLLLPFLSMLLRSL